MTRLSSLTGDELAANDLRDRIAARLHLPPQAIPCDRALAVSPCLVRDGARGLVLEHGAAVCQLCGRSLARLVAEESGPSWR